METRKLILYGLIVFLIFMIGYLLFIIFINKNNPTKETGPIISPAVDYQTTPSFTDGENGNYIIISGVKLNNFENSAIAKRENGSFVLADNNDYLIIYNPEFQQFALEIKSHPFADFRLQAEDKFVSILGVENKEFCKLDVAEITFQYANPEEAGQTYPLSFCR